MRIRLLAVDLDGTLLNGQTEISAGNRQALAAAAAGGVEIAIVTGPRFHSAYPFTQRLDCPVTLISSNGARVTGADGEVCHRNFLPRAAARAVVGATRPFRPHAVLMYDTPERGQVTMQEGASLEGPLAWYLKTAPRALLEVEDLEAAIAGDGPDPVQVLFGGPPGKLAAVEPLLEAAPVAARLTLTWTRYPVRNTSMLDVLARGCSKGHALQRWAARRGIDPAAIMAVGDNHNDREMLELAGCPVVMGNAEPGLYRDGWARTLSNDEDGVAAAVRRYVLEGQGFGAR